MSLFRGEDRRFAETVAALIDCNPFVPERVELEKRALGDEYTPDAAVWSHHPDSGQAAPNVTRIAERVDALLERLRSRGRQRSRLSRSDATLYEDLALYRAYGRQQGRFLEAIRRDQPLTRRVSFFSSFLDDLQADLGDPLPFDPAHMFACFFQVRRAFHQIFACILGRSMPMARLRAAAWQSIFTHDMRRYRESLYQRMGDITTLVTGPSGTGKELVARAIGMSRYIPFNAERGAFEESFTAHFYPLNLSALSPTLIESELFGHRRGSFTGAVEDRVGWLEVCPPLGTVFLDEIGELDPAIQVKILRTLEGRTFERLGETTTRRFHGKVIAATNRDLDEEMRAGRFRPDLYYRLCSDIIQTPSLHEQIVDCPEALGDLVIFLARRVAGDDTAPALAEEVDQWIRTRMPPDYDWPGNVRELEQCVRNVLIRRSYHPARSESDGAASLARNLQLGAMPADDLLRRYCAIVYRATGSYVETARRLGLDRRTVKARVDEHLAAGDPDS